MIQTSLLIVTEFDLFHLVWFEFVWYDIQNDACTTMQNFDLLYWNLSELWRAAAVILVAAMTSIVILGAAVTAAVILGVAVNLGAVVMAAAILGAMVILGVAVIEAW